MVAARRHRRASSLVLLTGTVTNVAGKAGTTTITHTARYAAKAVALEPATGFNFDTPAVWRPR